MLTDPASFCIFMTDFISHPIKTDKPGAFKFKNASCIFDDECNLNSSGEFSKSFHVIYPNESQKKSEHHGLHVNFLDLNIMYPDQGKHNCY